jgi:hypothetical protein
MLVLLTGTRAMLTLILPTWRKGWASNNASNWQVGFNSAFKGLILINNVLGGCAARLSTDSISSLPETVLVSDVHCNPCLVIIYMAARICFWNIVVYNIFQYWKVIASFCHYNCNKTVFFLLSLSTMAWFSHIMLKVLLFIIMYKESHFISIEYLFFFVRHFHYIKQGFLPQYLHFYFYYHVILM